MDAMGRPGARRWLADCAMVPMATHRALSRSLRGWAAGTDERLSASQARKPSTTLG